MTDLTLSQSNLRNADARRKRPKRPGCLYATDIPAVRDLHVHTTLTSIHPGLQCRKEKAPTTANEPFAQVSTGQAVWIVYLLIITRSCQAADQTPPYPEQGNARISTSDRTNYPSFTSRAQVPIAAQCILPFIQNHTHTPPCPSLLNPYVQIAQPRTPHPSCMRCKETQSFQQTPPDAPSMRRAPRMHLRRCRRATSCKTRNTNQKPDRSERASMGVLCMHRIVAKTTPPVVQRSARWVMEVT